MEPCGTFFAKEQHKHIIDQHDVAVGLLSTQVGGCHTRGLLDQNGEGHGVGIPVLWKTFVELLSGDLLVTLEINQFLRLEAYWAHIDGDHVSLEAELLHVKVSEHSSLTELLECEHFGVLACESVVALECALESANFV